MGGKGLDRRSMGKAENGELTPPNLQPNFCFASGLVVSYVPGNIYPVTKSMTRLRKKSHAISYLATLGSV